MAGEEFGVFQRLVALEKAQDFAAVISLCETQITRTPTWLTPYLFLGAAYANTGQREKAIANLRHVVTHAAGDPDYQRAQELLAKLEAAR